MLQDVIQQGQFSSPDYRNPPVVETGLTVQFDELDRFTSSHFGQFHSLILDEFPTSVDQPRVNSVVEEFPVRDRPRHLRLVGGQPNRVWYISDDERSLIQLQPDRFSFNWRLRSGEDYPRFGSNVEKFIDNFNRFVEFWSLFDQTPVAPNLCEVVYVNVVMCEDDESRSELFAKIFDGCTFGSGSLGLVPEAITLNRSFEIGDREGRLYIEAACAERESKPGVQLKVTARIVIGDGMDLSEQIRRAHDWVVGGFAAVVDQEFQRARFGRSQ